MKRTAPDQPDAMPVDEFRERLKAAFKALRQTGHIARQNFLCCNSCAGCKIATDIQAMPEARRARLRGVVTYHRQAAAGIVGRGVYVGFSRACFDADDRTHDYGPPTAQVGRAAAAAFTTAGLVVEWNGESGTKIFVRRVKPAAIPASTALAAHA